jgi:predicted dehydrogenase
MNDPRVSRRSFLSAGAAASGVAGLTAAGYGRVAGANDRVGVGFVGYGLIGKRHAVDFASQPDVRPAGVAEVHRGRRDEAVAFLGGDAKGHGDFRRLLDDPGVDAVVVSTPDHWHALIAMLACDAGKDVYVEKPMTLFVREGRWMIDVARRTGRVVQLGTQQRSGPHYRRARDLIRGGHIGKVVSVTMRASRNVVPGFGSPPDGDPPPELDYDLWLGPAPSRPYNPNRSIYHFRWFWDYSGGQMTNLGQHSLDIVDWVLGADTLRAVHSVGGRFALEDNGETPDVQDTSFAFDGWSATWSHRECARGTKPDYPLTFHGTRGSLGISRTGFAVTPDPDIPPGDQVPRFTGDHPVGGPTRQAAVRPSKFLTEPVEDRSGTELEQFRLHARNFLDCVKSRERPVSDVESGHRVSTLCHLANLSLRLGRGIRWDAQAETVLDDSEAASWLRRDYRSPWDRELRALGVGS